MPLQATSGAASYDGFGGGVVAEPNYIESCFSTYLYTGNNAVRSITNGIDLASKGGMVWFKTRNQSSLHVAFDTNRGVNKYIFPNQTDAQNSYGAINDLLTSFNADGFSLGADGLGGINGTGDTQVSWTFRKSPKFFDVVTGTANSSGNVSFNHSLGSAPGFVIIKSTTNASTWTCYHQSLGPDKLIQLNTTNAAQNVSGFFTSTATTFSANTGFGAGAVGFVAYLFAHNAGGFGLSGTDNVITCGSYTTDASGLNSGVSLGYEPQWIMYKRTDSATGGGWYMQDNMRGMTANGEAANLFANTSGAESSGTYLAPTATGFSVLFAQPNATYIYIAIRRGPMKVPTTGTSVFSPNAQNTGTTPLVTTNFPVDLSIGTDRTGASRYAVDRLRGTTAASGQYLETNSTSAEAASGGGLNFANNTGFTDAFLGYSQSIFWNFRRAPGFFDEVCYTGSTVGGRVLNHNLGVAPELLIFKSRTTAPTDNEWNVQCVFGPSNRYYILNATGFYTGTLATSLNATTINLSSNTTNDAANYVAYLFASCPNVSKVGSYTGNGATQTINCGFTGGARFVLIKSTSTTGDWYVWDSARGIVAGNDPYLRLNSTAAEVTTTDWVDTAASGFELSNAGGNLANSNGVSYVFLAVA